MRVNELALQQGRQRSEAARKAAVDSRPQFTVPAVQADRKRTEELRHISIEGERQLNEILSKDCRSKPVGRKPDPAYDKASYRARVAEICGRKIPTSTLVREILADDKSGEEFKLDKMKKALKRRKRKL